VISLGCSNPSRTPHTMTDSPRSLPGRRRPLLAAGRAGRGPAPTTRSAGTGEPPRQRRLLRRAPRRRHAHRRPTRCVVRQRDGLRLPHPEGGRPYRGSACNGSRPPWSRQSARQMWQPGTGARSSPPSCPVRTSLPPTGSVNAPTRPAPPSVRSTSAHRSESSRLASWWLPLETADEEVYTQVSGSDDPRRRADTARRGPAVGDRRRVSPDVAHVDFIGAVASSHHQDRSPQGFLRDLPALSIR